MPAQDELDPAFVAALVGNIYEAAVDPRRWSDFVDIIERVYPDARVTFFGHENGRPSPGLTIQKNFADAALRDYVEYHVRNSPYVARVDRVTVGKPSRLEEMITDGELMQTEHYNDFVRPHRLGHYATGILLERAPNLMTAFSIADHKDDPVRRGRQMRLLEILAPHLNSAMRLRRSVAAQNAATRAAQAAFDRWSHPAFILSASGHVVVMNASAQTLVQKGDDLSLTREGALRSFDKAQTFALETLIQKCAALALSRDIVDAGADTEGLALARPSGAPALHAMVWPLPAGSAYPEFGVPNGCLLLMIFDPQQVQRTPVQWLRRRFGLSPSEARLTEAIVNGVPLNDAAEQFGIKLSSARTRLKIIQAKTGCHRQVDLVRLAMTLPSMRWE